MKVVTATGIPEINDRLKAQNEYEVIGRDIQYQEGILELLEEREDIELVIVSNNLPEEMNFNILISKIINMKENIEIIVILKEKDENIEMFLNSKKIYKIYYLDNYEIFFMSLKNTMSNTTIAKNIEDFKKIILEEKKEIRDENINIEKLYYEKYLSRAKCISILGVPGSGKSVISILLAKYLSKYNRVLLIDFDFFNKSISTILGIKQTPNNFNKTDLSNLIVKYEKNLEILASLDVFIKSFEIKNYTYIVDIFENLKNDYDFIIIDTSSNSTLEERKIIFSNSTELLFLIEPNLSEIKKSNLYLEKIIKDFDIDPLKINIVFNKTNKYKISENVLKEIYSGEKIIGEISYSDKYNLLINKNIFKGSNEYENVFEKLLKKE